MSSKIYSLKSQAVLDIYSQVGKSVRFSEFYNRKKKFESQLNFGVYVLK